MLKTRSDPSLVSLSTRVYRALLAAYPPRFRQEYGSSMLQVFRVSCRREYQEGEVLGLLAVWGRTALDYLITLIEEYAHGGTNMTREKFIKLSGWALIIGSVAIFVGWMAESRPDYDQFNAAALPIDRYASMAAAPLIVLGILLVSVGMLGLLRRYGARAGGFWRACLGLGALSGHVSAAGMVGMSISENEPWWSMFLFGWVLQYLMLALFGVVCIQRRILPRWNGLPLLAGIWLPGFILISLVYELQTGTWFEPQDAVFFALFMSGAVGFAGLGYLLQSDSSPSAPAAGAF